MSVLLLQIILVALLIIPIKMVEHHLETLWKRSPIFVYYIINRWN